MRYFVDEKGGKYRVYRFEIDPETLNTTADKKVLQMFSDETDALDEASAMNIRWERYYQLALTGSASNKWSGALIVVRRAYLIACEATERA